MPVNVTNPNATARARGRSRDEDFAVLRQFADALPDLPPPGIDIDESAPSPTIGFNKQDIPELTAMSASPSPAVTPQKEKPGFFRRVFGGGSGSGSSSSSKNASAKDKDNQSVYSHPYPRPLSGGSRSVAGSGGGGSGSSGLLNSTSANASSATAATSGNSNGAGSGDGSRSRRDSGAPLTLAKKPSAFFRRRKKSTSRTVQPPKPIQIPKPPPAVAATVATAGPASQDDAARGPDLSRATDGSAAPRPFSPSSGSLSNFMKPFLASPDRPPTGFGADAEAAVNAAADDEADSTEDRGAAAMSPENLLGISPQARQGLYLADNSEPDLLAGVKRPTSSTTGAQPPTLQSPALQTPTLQSQSKRPTQASSPQQPSPSGAPNVAERGRLDRQPSRPDMEPPPTTAPEMPPPPPLQEQQQQQPSTLSPPPFSTPPPPQIIESMEPTTEDRDLARRLFEIDNDKPSTLTDAAMAVASWLGDPNRAMVRHAYMELFNWGGFSILNALRALCSRIALKGEAQQVDRVLDAFSSRWCACNPEHWFKDVDVVHTICYSLLLLNTDLHSADVETKMTKGQFIKNTMPTIRRVVTDAAPGAFGTIRTRSSSTSASGAAAPSSPLNAQSKPQSLYSTTPLSAQAPAASAPTKSTSTSSPPSDTGGGGGDTGSTRVILPRAPPRAWEMQVEAVLKEYYGSIQKQCLPLRGITDVDGFVQGNNLAGVGGSTLRRTPSSASAGVAGPNGRATERLAAGRWARRSRPRLYLAAAAAAATGSVGGSSRTSLDEATGSSSVWSPASSMTGSKHSLARVAGGAFGSTMSVDSVSSRFQRSGDYQQAIGFANALSHAILREDTSTAGAGASTPTVDDQLQQPPQQQDDLVDESLELAGAPWAKEGSLKHKHHLEGVDKRAKDRNWNDSFAVIQRGWMRLFSFNSSTKTARVRPKGPGLVVGGGNWMENAEERWKFLLRQTIASALPPPGYSKTRPHVFALSLPNGAVHLFQVGTPEIVREFVTTANYWSARLSKEPLSGGVSNIEYGWSDVVLNSAPTESRDGSKEKDGGSGNSMPPPPPPISSSFFYHRRNTSTAGSIGGSGRGGDSGGGGSGGGAATVSGRPSFHSSVRTSFEKAAGSGSGGDHTGAVHRSSASISSTSSPSRGRGHTISGISNITSGLAGAAGAAAGSSRSTVADRLHISDWSPPQQSMMASRLSETDQLRSLQTYIGNVEVELARHNECRPLMAAAFSARSTNGAKAGANWERKSSYLLREIVKFRTYVDALLHAARTREGLDREVREREAMREQREREQKDKQDGVGSGDRQPDMPISPFSSPPAPAAPGTAPGAVPPSQDAMPPAPPGIVELPAFTLPPSPTSPVSTVSGGISPGLSPMGTFPFPTDGNGRSGGGSDRGEARHGGNTGAAENGNVRGRKGSGSDSGPSQSCACNQREQVAQQRDTQGLEQDLGQAQAQGLDVSGIPGGWV